MSKDAIFQADQFDIQENNIMNEATLEMTLGLQGGMKEDEMKIIARVARDVVREDYRPQHSCINKERL